MFVSIDSRVAFLGLGKLYKQDCSGKTGTKGIIVLQTVANGNRTLPSDS